MEDFHKISVLADLQQDKRREIEEYRRQSRLVAGPRFNLRRVFISVTVVLLGMLAWWGQ